MLGVLVGAVAGASVLARTRAKKLRVVFSLIILLLAAEMIFNGFRGLI
jgi:hypothetical protein